MSESKLWKEVEDGMFGKWHATRVENHIAGPGFPDVNYCIKGNEGTLELKYGTLGKMPDIRSSQIKWIKKRVMQGGKVYILTKVDKWCGDKPLYLIHHGGQVEYLDANPKWDAWFDIKIFGYWGNEFPFDLFEDILSGGG